MKVSSIILICMLLLTTAFGHNSYTGYAGSPVSSGSCAASCHGGANSFTPTVMNWPTAYTPGQAYTIIITHNGNTMSNFNACVLRQSNNTAAGTLSGGINTNTYIHPTEGTGVHGSSNNQTSYTFGWVAPSPGIGVVTLYVAVHEDGIGGPNGACVLSAGQLGIEEIPSVQDVYSFSVLSSNPVSREITISIAAKVSSRLKLTLHDINGKTIDVILDEYVSAGSRIITYRPRISTGVYFLRLNNQQHQIGNSKIIMVK